jgi:hypothetical protein
MGWTVPILSDAIKEMCDRWKPNGRPQFQKVPLKGVADDACFAAAGHSRGSIADEFRRLGISYTPARKADRLSGWTTLKRLLADAGKPDVPGLYIARHCEYFWQTVPYLGRDPRRVEDVDSRQADHAADAARYACLRLRRSITQSDLWGRDASIARKPSDYRTVIREFEEKAGIDLSPNSFTTAERQRFEQSPPPSRKSDKA